MSISTVLKYLFLFSGGSAIIYQLCWQRILFTSFGSNIESITIIVSIFMFGLGIGSLIGGVLSEKYDSKLVLLFFILEFLIGLFGIFSINIIQFASQFAYSINVALLPFVTYGVIGIPTLFMGATLPILVEYLSKKLSIGDTVSELYYFNTLGSAIFCLLTIGIFYKLFTLSLNN